MEYPIIVLEKKLGEITEQRLMVANMAVDDQDEYDEQLKTCNELGERMDDLNLAIQTLKH